MDFTEEFKESFELGMTLYEIHSDLEKYQVELSDYDLKGKAVLFNSLCEFVKIANQALIEVNIKDENFVNYYRAFYKDNLSLDGCYQPNIEFIFNHYFSYLRKKKSLSSKEQDILYDVEDAFESTELILFNHDDICEKLINEGLVECT